MRRLERIQDPAFFLLFYLYLWLEVDTRLLYHGGPMIVKFPVFFAGWDFFRQCLSFPAGLLEYLSAFLSQLLRFSWAGALVVTVQAWLFSFFTAACLKAMGSYTVRGCRFAGPILLLVLYAGYNYHFKVTMMALLAPAFAWAYAKARPSSDRRAAALFIALHAAVYAVAGGGHLAFAALCALHELIDRRRWKVALACLASAVLVPLVVGGLVFGVAPAAAIGYALFAPLEPHVYGRFASSVVKLSLLYLFLPLCLPILRLFRGTDKGEGIAPLAAFGAPFVMGGLAALVFRDSDAKAELEIGYLSYHRMWPEVLEVAERLREEGRYPNPCVIHAIDRALYHTGRLGRDLFRHPQDPRLLLLTDEGFPEIYVNWYAFDTFIDLGQMNYAAYHLNQCAEYFGPRPAILKRLALVHMVKGDVPTARVYLKAAAGTVFDAGWALGYLEKLKTDPDLSADPEIRRLRGLAAEIDRTVQPARYWDKYGFADMERVLLDLLQKNPANRMALEYLMAMCMLNKRLDDFGRHLDAFRRLGPPEVPRLYEEAALARMLAGRIPPESVLSEVSAGSRARAEMFMRALGEFRVSGDPRRLDEFRDGYLFYYFCVDPPP